MIVLGIDPGTASLGYGIVERTGGELRSLDHGVISTRPDTGLPDRLLEIRRGLEELLVRHRPDLVAVERLVDVDERGLGQAVRREQPVHQRLQSIGLLHDDLRIFVQVGPVEFAFEQLRGAANAAQRVLDLVRQVAHQFLVGLRKAVGAFLTVLADLLLDRNHLDQHAVGALGTTVMLFVNSVEFGTSTRVVSFTSRTV